jgi:hypothetical protein
MLTNDPGRGRTGHHGVSTGHRGTLGGVRAAAPASDPAWSSFGPHALGTERFPTVTSGTSFAQVTGAILREHARAQNPDKDEVPRFRASLPTPITYTARRSCFSSSR